jgi:hypothetical protein
MPEPETELVLKNFLAKRTKLARLSMPRLEYAKRAALAELDPGSDFAMLELKRVFPILIYLRTEDNETEARYRFLLYELLAAARFTVIAEFELYGSKTILLFPEHYLPTTSETFWERVKAIPFKKRLQQVESVATVLVGIHAGIAILPGATPDPDVPHYTETSDPEAKHLVLTMWHKAFHSETDREILEVLESALVIARFCKLKNEGDENPES